MIAVVRAAVSQLDAGGVAETRLSGQAAVQKVFQTQRVAVDDDTMTAVVLTLAASPCRRTAGVHSRHYQHQQQQRQGEWVVSDEANSR